MSAPNKSKAPKARRDRTMTTAETLLHATADQDREEIRIASEAVARYLAADGNLLIDDKRNDRPSLYELFDQIAGEDCQQHAENLLLFPNLPAPDRPGGILEADAEACARWIAVVDSAYYAGLLIGLRLAGGAK